MKGFYKADKRGIQVDKLGDVAGRLLYGNQDFRRLVSDIGGNIPAKTHQLERAVAIPLPENGQMQ